MPATLFIGLGTSGLRVLEQIQRLYYGNGGSNLPSAPDGTPMAQMIFVETNSGVQRTGQTPGRDAIQAQYIPLRGAKTSIESLKVSTMKPDVTWLPDPQLMEHKEEGAGGMRCFGRLALWSTPDDGGANHFTQLAVRIQAAWEKMGSPADVQVMIVSSLCGGTGSGVFLDVAYLARFCISPGDPSAANVNGLMLLPPSFLNAQQGPRIQANAWGCLYDLDHYSRGNEAFTARWPVHARPPGGFNQGLSPFKLVTFMSQAREAGGEVSFEHQLKLAALFLFIGSVGFQDYRGARVVDAQADEHEGSFSKYSFANLAALVYPKLEIEEAAAIQLATAFLERLCKSADCPGPKISGNIEVEANKRPVARHLDPLLSEAFTLMNKAGEHDSIELLLQEFAQKAARDELADPVREFRLALQETDGRYYHLVKPRAAEVRKLLTEGLVKIIRQAMEDSSSVPYCRLIYSRCRDHMSRTLQWMRGFEVEGDRWAKRTDALARWAFSTRFGYMPGARRAVLYQRLCAALELLKMHFLVPVLAEICQHIDGNASPHLPGLPRLADLDEIASAMVRAATGPARDEESRRASYPGTLKDRINALRSDGDSQRQQIHVYFPSGSFEEEVSRAVTRLDRILTVDQQQGLASLVSRLLSRDGTAGQPLFDQLWESGRSQDLYAMAHICVANYMELLRQHNVVPDLNIEEVIDRNAETLTALAQKSARAPLMTLRPKANSADYPKVIVAQNAAIAEGTVRALRQHNCNLFQEGPNRIAVCQRLRNMLIFVDERSDRFQPLEDIQNTAQWKSQYDAISVAKKDAYGLIRESKASQPSQPEKKESL